MPVMPVLRETLPLEFLKKAILAKNTTYVYP